MSKTQLKRELQHLDADQLRELLVEVYEARKEAKEYLDFFINPDIDKMMEKYKTAANKEIGRVTRHRARPRVTRLRKLIKDFSGFNPGAEYEAELMTYIIEQFCSIGADNWIKESTQQSMAKHVGSTLVFIDRHGIVNDYLPRITKAIENMKPVNFYCSGFKRLLRETVEQFKTLL